MQQRIGFVTAMRRGMLALGLAGCSAGATAADVAGPPPSDGLLATSRAALRSTTLFVAREVDGWFGDKPFAEGGGVHDGRLSVNAVRQPGLGTDYSVGFNARFRLPNLEEQSYVFVGRDDPDEVVADTPKAFTRQERLLNERGEAPALFAGLGVALREAVELRLGMRGGLKPYGQARFRRATVFGEERRDRVEFRQTLFWSLRDRFGSTTSWAYERAVSNTVTWRWLSSATITQASEGWAWSSSVGPVKSFGAQRSLSLDALVTGQRDDVGRLSEYGLLARGVRPVHEDWLLGQLSVGRYWAWGEHRPQPGRRWAVGVSAIMLF